MTPNAGIAGEGLRVFVSAVSNGLKLHRSIATEIVAAQGFVPVVQEHFSTPTQHILHEIRGAISKCAAGLFIVGPAYGHPSPVPHGGMFPLSQGSTTDQPLSYSQFEFFYARRLGRPCLVLLVKDDCEFSDCQVEEPRLRLLQDDYRKYLYEANLREQYGWQSFADRFEFVKALARFRWSTWYHA